VELESAETKVAYYGGKGRYVLKVYDAAGTKLSEYFLNKLTESGAFMVCRVKAPEMTAADFDARLDTDKTNDRMGAAVYLGKNFDPEAELGVMQDGMRVVILSQDARKDLLKNSLTIILGQIRAAAAAGPDTAANLKQMNAALPKRSVETLVAKDAVELTDRQVDQRTMIGYAFAILTLGFIFAGIFVAQTVISEQKDMVLTRIRLTKLSNLQYFTAKFLSATVVSFLLTMVMAGCSFMIPDGNLGMGRITFLLMIFLLGLIFSTLSLMMGILFGNVMSANIAAFTVWSLSSMLAGLYFPLESTTKAVKAISYLMPQKWFLKITEYLMTGDSKGYIILIGVTVAYMLVFLSLGSVGIRIRNNE
jgi:ABC-type multidrug transport system permease subunit